MTLIVVLKPHQVKQVRNVIINYRWPEKPMPRSETIIYWNQADEAFIAEVPELPGCAADGETCEEALAGIEIIIQEWIETAKELRRPIPASQGRLRLSVSAERFRAPAKEKSKVKNPMVRFRSPHAA